MPAPKEMLEPWMPQGLSRPAQRALRNGGFASLKALAKAREADVASLHGMGPTGIAVLKAALKQQGLTFKK